MTLNDHKQFEPVISSPHYNYSEQWFDVNKDNEDFSEEGILTRLVLRTYQMYGWADLSLYEGDSGQEAVDRLGDDILGEDELSFPEAANNCASRL